MLGYPGKTPFRLDVPVDLDLKGCPVEMTDDKVTLESCHKRQTTSLPSALLPSFNKLAQSCLPRRTGVTVRIYVHLPEYCGRHSRDSIKDDHHLHFL